MASVTDKYESGSSTYFPTTPISIDSLALWIFEQRFFHLDKLGFCLLNPSLDSTILPKDCSSR